MKEVVHSPKLIVIKPATKKRPLLPPVSFPRRRESRGKWESGIEPGGKVVIGTVKGDLHDIGKNLVIMSLQGAGFEVVDLGIDVPADKFVDAVNENQPVVVALSALLTTTMTAMKDTVEVIKAIEPTTKIMIGGAPVNQQFCDEIGADFYGYDSTSGRNYARQVAAKLIC